MPKRGRYHRGKFRKGNPIGRENLAQYQPKLTEAKERTKGIRSPEHYDLVAACRALTPKALEVITEIMNMQKCKPVVRLRASEFIIERGWGLPRMAEEDGTPPDEYAAAVRAAQRVMADRTLGRKAKKEQAEKEDAE